MKKNKFNIKSLGKVLNNYKKYLFAVVFLFIAFFTYDKYFTIPVKSELSQIQKIASDYKIKNGNFGVLAKNNNQANPNKLTNNCFEGITFVKDVAMNEVLNGPDVENISCVFKTATNSPVVEEWSITIVKGEKAYCEDSAGFRMETPGLTTSEKCNLN